MIEINKFLEYIKLRGFSNYTYESYKEDLESFVAFFKDKNIKDITVKDIRNYIRRMYDKKYKAATISRHISTLKSFYNFLETENIIKTNPMTLISNPKKEKKLPNYLNYEDTEKLLHTPDINTKDGLMAALILEMLYSTGVRVGELVNIKVSDINKRERTILVFGKGRKERIVFYGSNCEKLLNKYLDKHDSIYLFTNKHGNKINERMVRSIVSDMALKAHLNVKVTPHTLRHTYATHLLNDGADLKSVGDLLGHENLSTTGIYTHVSNDRLRKVYLNSHPRAKK